MGSGEILGPGVLELELEYWRCVGAGERGVREAQRGLLDRCGMLGKLGAERMRVYSWFTFRVVGDWLVRFSSFLPCCDCDFCDFDGLNEHHFPGCHCFTRNRALQSLILLSVPGTTMSRTEEECVAVTESAVG